MKFISSLLLFISLSVSASNCYQDVSYFLSEALGENIELDKMDLKMNFYDKFIAHLSDGEITRLNKAISTKLKSLEVSEAALSPAKIESLHHDIKSLNVIEKSCGEVNDYDPNNQVGLCFGRAMVSHFEALRQRVKKENILKIWYVGEFKDAHWNHHVALLVRASDKAWYVLDPLYDHALKLEDYSSFISNKFGSRIVIVPTTPRRFLSSKGVGDKKYRGYSKKQFGYDFSSLQIYWKEFFEDALKEFKRP